MDRRKSIKTLIIGGISVGALLKPVTGQTTVRLRQALRKRRRCFCINRMKEEMAHEKN